LHILAVVKAPAVAPPEAQIDPEDAARYEDELRRIADVPLPDDDDEL
jgi:GTP-binding nuclear protein Ran